MSNETIEQKTHRIMVACLDRPEENRTTLEDILVEGDMKLKRFMFICKVAELAIAEEREANIRICERIYFEANAPLSKDALNCAIAIRGRIAAPKAEVSE